MSDMTVGVIMWVICGIIGSISLMKYEWNNNVCDRISGVELTVITIIGIISGVIGFIIFPILLVITHYSLQTKLVDYINKQLKR